jgi:hypothetical protein
MSRWLIIGVLALALIAGIALYVAPTPTNRFEVWKLVLDKGALALLIAIAGTVLGIALKKAKAAEAWATEVARERIAVSRRLMDATNRLVNGHNRWRTAQRFEQAAHGLVSENEALREMLAGALDLKIAAHEAALFFDEPLGQLFEGVVERSKAFMEREKYYPKADEIEVAALGVLMSEAARALRERLASDVPSRERR